MTIPKANHNYQTNRLSAWIIEDCKKSGLSDCTIEEMNLEEIFHGKQGTKQLKDILGFGRMDNYYIVETTSSYAIPYPDQNYSRIKLQKSISNAKYLSPSKKHSSIEKPYFLPIDKRKINSPKYSLLITEGEKKTAKLSQELRKIKDHNFVAVGIPGVTIQKCIRNSLGLSLKDRNVYIVFDSDFRENRNVKYQMVSLYLFLDKKGAFPKILTFEGAKGIDDYLVLKKEKNQHEVLLSLIQQAEENIFKVVKDISYKNLADLLVKNFYRKAEYKALWEKFSLKEKYGINFSTFNALVRSAYNEKQINQSGEDEEEIEFIYYNENDKQIVISGLAAAEYVRRQKGNFLYAFEEFWKYEGGIWKSVVSRKIKKEVQEMIGDSLAKKSIIEDVVYQITNKILPPDDFVFNQNLWLINFYNGVLDIENSKFMEHCREFYQTIQLPFEYDEGAKCKKWKTFLKSLDFEDETYLRLQEWVGYTLVPSCRLEKCLFFVGEGQNGKNTLLETWGYMLGDNTSNVELTNIFQRFKTAELQEKLVNISGDICVNKALNEEFKDLVSGKKLSVERKYQPSFEFTPIVRFLFSANEFLITKDHSTGFFRRFDVLRFKRQFSEKERDEALKDKLKRELPGIFNWALEGLKRLIDNNWKMTYSSEFDLTHKEFQNYSNPLRRFIDEECKTHEHNLIAAKELRERYVNWCKDNGYHPLANNKLGMEMKRLGFEPKRKKRADGKVYRVYLGVTINLHEN